MTDENESNNGHWSPCDDTHGRCDNCGCFYKYRFYPTEKYPNTPKQGENYCPNCGQKMYKNCLKQGVRMNEDIKQVLEDILNDAEKEYSETLKRIYKSEEDNQKIDTWYRGMLIGISECQHIIYKHLYDIERK